jgi:hypothetical protein
VDLITTALTAAAQALGNAAVKDLYDKFKGLLTRVTNNDAAVQQAVARIEQSPAARGNATKLSKALKTTAALSNQELLSLADQLTRLAHGAGASDVTQTIAAHESYAVGHGTLNVTKK